MITPFIISCEFIEDISGSCPYDFFGHKFSWCEDRCGTCKISFCWQAYFQELAKLVNE